MAARRPLITDGDVSVLAALAIAVAGTPLWLVWRGWRRLRGQT